VKHLPILLLILSGTLTGSNLAIAEGLDLSGFVQMHGAVRSKNVDCPPGTKCSVPFNDQRMQLKAEGSNEDETRSGKAFHQPNERGSGTAW